MFEFVIKINLLGTFNVSRLVAAQMTKNTPTEDGNPSKIPLFIPTTQRFSIHSPSFPLQVRGE